MAEYSLDADDINAMENHATFWSGVRSNREWAQGAWPGVVEAMLANARNSERSDQWVWIRRADHYARTGELLDESTLGADEAIIPAAKKK